MKTLPSCSTCSRRPFSPTPHRPWDLQVGRGSYCVQIDLPSPWTSPYFECHAFRSCHPLPVIVAVSPPIFQWSQSLAHCHSIFLKPSPPASLLISVDGNSYLPLSPGEVLDVITNPLCLSGQSAKKCYYLCLQMYPLESDTGHHSKAASYHSLLPGLLQQPPNRSPCFYTPYHAAFKM